MRINKSIVGGVFFLLLSLAIWFTIPYQIKVLNEDMINAQFLPKTITMVMLILSVLLLIQSIVKAKKNGTAEKDIITIQWSEETRVLLAFVLLVVYAIVMPMIGFLISSIVVSGLVLLLMKVKKWTYYVYTFALAVFIHVIFKYALNIQLP